MSFMLVSHSMSLYTSRNEEISGTCYFSVFGSMRVVENDEKHPICNDSHLAKP